MTGTMPPDRPTVKGKTLDNKRRVTLPDNFEAGAPVTIILLEDGSVIIRPVRPEGAYKLIPIALVDRLTDDPEMDGFAHAAVRAGQTYTEPA